MTLRLKGQGFEIQPLYDAGSDQFTLVFHHGGQFMHIPEAKYLGGDTCVFDHVEADEVSMLYMHELCNSAGLYGDKKFYTLEGNGFVLLRTDGALYKLCKECPSPRVVDLYVYAELSVWNGQVGSSNIVGEIENHELGGDEDYLGDDSCDSDYSGETDSEDDMAEFDDKENEKNIDNHGESSKLGDGEGVNNGADAFKGTVDDESDDGSADLCSTESELQSLKGSDDETLATPEVAFNPQRDMNDPDLVCGLVFNDLEQFKEAIMNYSIKRGRPVQIYRSEESRCSAKCRKAGCGWNVSVSLNRKIEKYEIRKLNGKHTCNFSYRNCNVKSGWVAKRYIKDFVNEPNPNIKNFRKKVMEEVRCHFSRSQAYRTRDKALQLIRGLEEDEYRLIWNYIGEIKRSDRAASMIVKTTTTSNNEVAQRDGDEVFRECNIPLVIERPRFQRLYCSLAAMKKGMISGNRRIFGIDGCHLRGKFGGMLLAAVGLDPNNNLFPIAHAAVEGETKDSWVWFLENLRQDLAIQDDSEWTIISDKQKGLIQACEEVFPMSAHRFCVRHLHANFVLAGFTGKKLKDALYEAATATTDVGFKNAMKKLSDLDPEAAKWLENKHPSQWSRSHFSFMSKCDMLLNNVCESLNSRLVEAREMPLLPMFEWIRNYLMVRFQEARERAQTKWQGKKICPKVMKIVQKNMEQAADSIPFKADVGKYECKQWNGLQFAVNLIHRTCTCRKWGLTGIPCPHACAALTVENKDPEDYVAECYFVKTYMSVYALPIEPCVGLKQLPYTGREAVLPPLYHRGPGRPKKLRKKSKGEAQLKQIEKEKNKKKGVQKLSRAGLMAVCSKCKKEGHNKRTCGRQKIGSQNTVSEQEDEVMTDVPSTQQSAQNCKRKRKLQVVSKAKQTKMTNVENITSSMGLEAGPSENQGPIKPTAAAGNLNTLSPQRLVTRSLSAGNNEENLQWNFSTPTDVPTVWPYYRQVQDNAMPVPNFWFRNGKIFLPRSLIKEAMELSKKAKSK